MATFADLEFHRRSRFSDGVQATHKFDNGYEVSVINGDGAYADPGEWEVAVLYDGEPVYDTPITDDVLGHLSQDDVTEVMHRVAALPPRD